MSDNSATHPQSGPGADRQSYANLLRRVDLFASLDRVTLSKLAAHLQPLSYSAHAIIFRQGDAGDAFYLVAGGSVGVYTSGDKGAIETQVKVLHAGEPFGEMALLNNIPRTATIRVETDCEVLRLGRDAFVNLVREQPSVALAFAATLSRRLTTMLDRLGDRAAEVPSTEGPLVVAPAKVSAVGAKRGRWRPSRRLTGLIAALVIFVAGWFLPPPAGLSLNAWHALVLLFVFLPLLVFDAVMEGALAFLLACGWVLSGISDSAVALSGFATINWVLVVSTLIIGAAITQTGVLYRLALAAVTHLRGGFMGEASVLACAGQLFTPTVPNASSRIVIIAPLLRELVDALGYAPKSSASAGLAMAALVGFGQMSATTLTSGSSALLVAAVLPVEVRGNIDWITWTLYGAPFNVILFVGIMATILWYYRAPAIDRTPSTEHAQSLALQRALLGPMSRNEKIALSVGIGLIAGFITQPLHHIPSAWVAAIAVGVLSATRVINANTLRAVNWNFALLFGILISLATVFERTGLDRWFTAHIGGFIGDMSSSRVVFVIAVAVLCFLVNFVVRQQAAATLITIALAPVAATAGIHPFIVGLIAAAACNCFFLPYQSQYYLALEAGTDHKLFSYAQALPTLIAFAIWTLIAAALSVPAWRMMGLM